MLTCNDNDGGKMCNQSTVVTDTVSYWKLDELADIIDFFENVIAEKVNQGIASISPGA